MTNSGDFVSIKTKFYKAILRYVLIPSVITVLILLFLDIRYIGDHVINLINSNDTQAMKNVEYSIDSLCSLSNYFTLDKSISTDLRKDYSDYGAKEELEKYQDYRDIIQVMSVFYHLSDSINSLFLIPENVGYIYQVASNPYSKHSPKEITAYDEIANSKGKIVVIGIQNNPAINSNSDTISVGRSLVDPLDNDKLLGVFIINMTNDKIQELWDDGQITHNSYHLLMCENNIFFQHDNVDPDLKVKERIVNESKTVKASFRFISWQKIRPYLINVTAPDKYGIRIINVIPVDEIISEQKMILITGVITVCLTLILISFAAKKASEYITIPILSLQKSISDAEQNGLNIHAEEGNDEIGQLAHSFNQLSESVRELISKIKVNEKEKREAELSALQAQINPHFIYNTLNSIKIMSEIQGSLSISNIIGKFASFLRYCLNTSSEIVPLEDEIHGIDNYMAIMNFRYMNEIDYKCICPEELKAKKIPRFILQPLIENSIIHGFSKKDGQKQIVIGFESDSNEIRITVKDNGIGIPENVKESLLQERGNSQFRAHKHIGLENVNNRIKMMCGENYGISIESKINEYTAITVVLPCELIS
ncbi:MAG: sensor histidine kinase [Lachnospiraceae bacterium]|jgi:two-component system sensor histidine kinase YesM|nr:sensor histidine kinase [Lachnospiraceae bacterium]